MIHAAGFGRARYVRRRRLGNDIRALKQTVVSTYSQAYQNNPAHLLENRNKLERSKIKMVRNYRSIEA